jgi:hypothetical protein
VIHHAGHDIGRVAVIGLRSRIGHEQIMPHTTDIPEPEHAGAPADTRDSPGLSRLSGVRQPSISQFLSGRVELSDDQFDQLLSCMGYRLEVTWRPVVPDLTRAGLHEDASRGAGRR